jgi:hypothetical protein
MRVSLFVVCVLLIPGCTTELPVNHAPTVSIDQREPSIANGSPFEFTATFNDPDEDDVSVTWYVDNEEQPSAADSGSLSLLFTPESETMYRILIVVSDGRLEDEDETTLTVSGPNGGIQLSVIPSLPDFSSIYLPGDTLTLDYGSSVLIDAIGVTQEDECAWYVDGDVVRSGAGLNRISVGSGLSLGYHTLSLVVVVDGEYLSSTLEILVA